MSIIRNLRCTIAACTLAIGLFAPVVHAADLRVALSTNLNTLDPATTTLGDEYVYNGLVFSGLTRATADATFEPDLALSWTSTVDLTSWTFKLRPGVKFHHGKELKAEDVVFSFQRILDPATGSAGRSQLEVVSKVEAVDDLTVRFVLNQPYASFPALLTGRQMRIVASDRAATLKTEPSGTGPFRFVKFVPGDSLELAKNPDYYAANRVKLDRVVLRIIPEAASRAAALRAGDLDVVWNLPLDAVAELQRTPGVSVDSRPSATWDAIFLNNGKPPFNDVRVRRAVLLALDKNAMVQFALGGQGAATHSPIAPFDPAFNKDIGFATNIPEAKRLLTEAGYPNGFDITLTVPVGRPARERLGVVAQQMLKEIGIRVTVQRMPYNRYTEVSGIAPMWVDGFFANLVVDASIYPWFSSKGSWTQRLWHFSSPKVDSILDEARRSADPMARQALYRDFQREVVEQAPGVVAYVTNVATAFRSDVKHYKTNPFLWLDLLDVENTAAPR